MIVDEILPQLPDFLVNRDPDSHKGHYGHALLVAGSFGKMGAAVLAAKACLRSGVGLLTVHVPRCGVEIMQTAVPEAMLSVDVNGDCFSQCPPDMDRYDAVAVGPGLGTYAMSFSAFHLLLKQMKRQPLPMVVDADGLNLLSMHKGVLMDCLPPMSILTPHAREFERLYCRQMEPSQELFATSARRSSAVLQMAKKRNIVLIHKGHRSLIASPDGHYSYNTTGNAGMATAGSGDVLTGILLGLSAQCEAQRRHGVKESQLPTPYEIARLGAFLHGKSSDLAVEKQAMCTLLASDIVENLKCAIG